ncbi:PUB50, partial [Symbiodinium sp. CCMP2592]
VAQEMLGERFRRQMLMDGHYAGNLAFVATCTDDLTLSELRKNLKIGDDVPQKEAAVLRNEKTKERILADTFAGIRRIQAQSDSKRSSNEELQARGIFPAVFTTSARDYQKLRGLLDTKVDGRARIWSTVEDTEIPAFRLWLHAQGRKADLAALESAQQRTQTVLQKLQESSTGEIVEQGLVQRWAEDARHTIQAVMDEVIRGCMKKAKTEMQESLMQQLKVGQQEATEAAGQSFEKRCQPMGRGGLHWCTFKATCRREGEWRESFNELLADPLNRAIAVKWDQTLNSFLPQCVQDALDTLCSELSELQKKHLLPGQAFKEAAEWLQGQGPGIKASMQKRQMELSRQIKETIQGLMRPSYKQAAGMSGGGTDVRQKQVIYTQVKERGGSMFQRACAFLQEELSQLLASLEKNLAASVATAIARLEQSMIRLSAQGKEMEALRCLRGAVAEAIAELEKKAEGRKESLQVLKDLVTAKVARALPTPPTEISTRIDAIPNEFICPISQQVMEDPVQTADGYSYERSHIAEWLSRNSISPMTGKQLENKVVVPNHSLRKLITDSGHGPKISTSSGPAAEVSADEDMDEQELFSVPMEEEESADRFEVFPEVSSLAAPSDLGADLGMAEDDEPRSPEESVENQSFVDDTRVAAGDSDLDLDQLLESVMNEANLDNDSAGNYNGRLDNEEELEEPILGEGLLPDGDEELFQSADEAVAAAA